jgi:rRNA maturation RNase YbeY
MAKTEIEKLHFHFLVHRFYFPNQPSLKQFVLERLEKENKEVESVNIIFCDDDYLLEINRQYLKHDFLTDIITFELSPRNQPLLSDIYISLPRVKENAKKFGMTFQMELHRVIFHGFLHLLGHTDKTKAAAARMRLAENAWLADYFVSRGTGV